MRKQKRKPLWQRINHTWLPEVIVLMALVLMALYSLLIRIVDLASFEKLLATTLAHYKLTLFTLESQDIFVIIIAIAFIYFLVQRLRYHILRISKKVQSCPVCHHRMTKKPRKPYQRFINIFIPVRHYYCRNCSWQGLRVYGKRGVARRSRIGS